MSQCASQLEKMVCVYVPVAFFKAAMNCFVDIQVSKSLKEPTNLNSSIIILTTFLRGKNSHKLQRKGTD